MNINKSISIMLFILVFFTLITSVSAVNDAKGNFTELNNKILSDDIVSLDKDYLYQSGENNISITKSVTIEGNNHTIDVNNTNNLFKINNSIIIKNISFKNIDQLLFDFNSTNMTIINCDFSLNNINNSVWVKLFIDDNPSYSSEITEDVEKLAKSIVGNTTGIEAAKLLANWVNDNIDHETESGFYQSPSETIKRKKGNCCCHTELFLQMCVVIGIDEEHTLSVVHVGTIDFGERHFFCLIDNLCVDTDRGFSNPWGHGGISGRDVYSITEYPLLPITRTY